MRAAGSRFVHRPPRRSAGASGAFRAGDSLQDLLAFAVVFLGACAMIPSSSSSADVPAGPRAEAWKRVQQALDEGKPKTAIEGLAGVEAAATADRQWAEVARAIATRILGETGDRPPDDPERLVLLANAIAKAPPETRGVLDAIAANWTWGYFQMNRWRYQQRTQGGAAADTIASIAEWDLPTVVAEIRRRFATAVAAEGSPERAALQRLPVGEWSAIIPPGTMADAYRPTVWDVIVRDAIEFSGSGERGLVAPEDAFEIDAASPALGSPAAFLAWRPEADPAFTDADAPLVDALRLYRGLLQFHQEAVDGPDGRPAAGKPADGRRVAPDRAAFLAADLDRILWAGGVAVAADADDLFEAKRGALEGFVARAGDHETAALARFHLANLVRQGAGHQENDGDAAEARRIALAGAEAHPRSPGGAMCRNLVAEIDSRELSLQAERSWAAPWPTVRITYRNLARVHLRLARADWQARLAAGRPNANWLDDADRRTILGLPAVRQAAVDLPATDDFLTRHHDVDVGAVLDAATLEPGAYWVIASHKPDFGEADNVVQAVGIRVTRLGIVTEQSRQVLAAAAGDAARSHGGHVVDIASGEPVAGATVRQFVREQRGNRQAFVPAATATTDRDGRYELAGEQGRESVLVAAAEIGGTRHEAATEPLAFWQNVEADVRSSIVLVTDRGIHRPGQTVFYKGIACGGNVATGDYRAVADRAIDVILRDANGREVARARHVSTVNGSFHGAFPIATGALPGQWSIVAEAAAPEGFSGSVGVRVEEYKRPKFLVRMAAPEKSVPLGGEVTLTGTATTYTGVAVAGAKVRWRVERAVRFPLWCRWFFPGLPFDAGGRRIARGAAVTDAAGRFSVRFPLVPDRAAPRESLPVFSYTVVADVTDPSGETRSDERTVRAGYTDVEATVAADPWQAVAAGRDAAVTITVATTTLDGGPRAATGTLVVSRLVQPEAVSRGDVFGPSPQPGPRPVRGGRGGRPAARPAPPRPVATDPATWVAGEAVFTGRLETAAATGRGVATASLPAGIYKAVFEIPAAGDVPAVKAEQVIEVVDPTAARYGTRRPLALLASGASCEPGTQFTAVVGSGYDPARALVEISRSGRVLERFWTAAGRTQWPVTVAVGEEHRGGFTVRAWLVRDGRLHVESRTIDVPWTNRKLAIAWERFRRRVEPGAKEVWRAKVTVPEAAPAAGGGPRPAGADPGISATALEMVATLYDESLDALAAHAWPADGLLGIFRRESGWMNLAFTNGADSFAFLHGSFTPGSVAVPEMTYRELRPPFGSPQRGGFGGRMMFRRMARGGMPMAMDAAPMAMAAAPANALAKAEFGADKAGGEREMQDRKQLRADEPGGPAGLGAAAAAAPPPPRRNLVETAFFLPAVFADAAGVVTIEFTVPDTLTTWRFKGLAHDAALASGTLLDTSVSAKDLMVEPVLPRFLREGDVVRIPVKVTNTSTGRLAGSVRLALSDARTDADRGQLVDGPREQPFDLAAGESLPVVFTLRVADGTEPLRILASGAAGRAADGEESLLAVLPRRVLVRESVPVTIRGPGERKVAVDRLLASAGTPIESQSLVVQATANPAWYAVLALPSIMEQADESVETLFTRLYANGLARHLATSDPRIEKVFAQWRAGDARALASPLETNGDLVKTLLAETPWVRDAVDEREARARIALLFDANRAAAELAAGLERLETLRNPDGGWPWFPGGQSCDPVTLGIAAGFGRLRAAGVRPAAGAADFLAPALATLPWIDRRLVEERARAERLWKDKPGDVVLTPIGAYALYARSFFAADAPPQGEAAAAVDWALGVGRRTWMKLDARLSQGHLAIALARSGDRDTARSIVDSLRQRAVDADVKPGAEQESWQGMWWRDPHPGWWSWTHAPIATQAVMIEAFDEVAGDAAAVEAMKVWLLARKRTSQWPGSRATADAVGALLGRGDDLLAARQPLGVQVGGERIDAARAEAGTGFFEERFVRREIRPEMGAVVLTKAEPGLAFGGVHWQYLDDIDRVPAAGRAELAIEKGLFVKRFTKAGPTLEPVNGAAARVEPGDEIVVRLVVKSDRDYEFLELHDHRASLTEPVDVLSGWRYGDGAGWYVAVRDASTQLFFERLPRGTHVFEYAVRAAHRGSASTGFATIQSRYAPEFSARSGSLSLSVE